MEEFSAPVEDGEEVELSLGLSIGRNPSKLQKLKLEAKPNNGVSHIVNAFIDSGKSQQNCKNHQMWRHEAWKKGEENRLSCASVEDREFQSRVKDRERKENEATRSERICKKDKGGKNGGIRDEQKNVNLCYKTNQTLNQNPYSDLNAFTSLPFHFVPIQYTFPCTNGFSFPYVMPCWAAPADTAATGSDNNVFQSVDCRICHSCQNRNPDATHYSPASCVTDKSSLGSNGSLESSSSTISDHNRCVSIQGRTSSDTTSSHSSHEQDRLSVPAVSNGKGQSLNSVSSHSREPSQGVNEATNFADNKVSSSNAAQSSLTNLKERAFIEPISSVKKSLLNFNKTPLSPTSHHNHHPLREAKVNKKKPPRPQPKQPQSPAALPQMPCVSTTGNGPNGKTINGLLYRYTKTEISIICACHGSSFSPAEFVEHAGGTDISNPLKCIKLHELYLPNC